LPTLQAISSSISGSWWTDPDVPDVWQPLGLVPPESPRMALGSVGSVDSAPQAGLTRHGWGNGPS
jgi:hypothetical protein